MRWAASTCRQRAVLHDDLRGIRRGWRGVLLLAHALVAQRELQAVVGGLQAGILQRALQTGGVVAQQVERVGTIRDQARGHVAVAVDVEPHLDAAELGRIEANLEVVLARLRLGRDFDGDAGNRDGRGLRGNRGRRPQVPSPA